MVWVYTLPRTLFWCTITAIFTVNSAMTLPIDSIKDTFLHSLGKQPLIVSAQTGSGKSTRLPLWAAQSGKVLVIEPRRIACTALAQYLAEQSNSPLGDKIGYAIRFESHFSADTRIVFATPGVVLRWFFENKLTDYQTVILDEFHERRWDTDLLLALLKKHNCHQLVVTSATLHAEQLASYLSGKILTAKGRSFPIEMRYHAADMRQMPCKEKLAERVLQACNIALSEARADILVFLAGKADIDFVASKLMHLPVLLVPLHGGSDAQSQTIALQSQSKRRIILATNIAETSLTLEGVDCVIDSGLEKRTHLRAGRTVLDLDTISMDSSMQRAGRAGRTSPGLCIRLYGEFAPLIAHTPAESQRCSLNEMVLSAACAGGGIEQLDFLEPLPASSLLLAKQQLLAINAIDQQGHATEHGKRLYPLPINSDLAHLITHMPTNALRQAMADAAALLAVPKQVYQLSQQLEHTQALNEQLPHHCDLELAIALIRGNVTDWVKVDDDALQEARQFAVQIRQAFDLPPLEKPASYQRSALIEAIATHLPRALFIHNARKNSLSNGELEVIAAKHSRFNNQSAALVLDTFSLAGKGVKQAKTLALCMAPICNKRIVALGLCTTKIEGAELDNNEIKVIIAHTFAGKVLATQSQLATPAQLPEAACQLIAQELILPGLWQKITHQLLWAGLYQQLNNCITTLPTTHEFIAQALTDLAIEGADDFELLSADDFAVHIIPEWEYADFTEKYPLYLQLPDLHVTVEYQLVKKLVVVHYLKGLRKEAPKRWELPSWSGLKIRYKKASKEVEIR